MKLEVTDLARGQVVREAFLGPVRRRRGTAWRETLLHLPTASDGLRLHLFEDSASESGPATLAPTDAAPTVLITVLSRRAATIALVRHGWRLLPGALAGSLLGAPGRVRAVLGQAPARAGEAPGYETWRHLYDRWGEAERTLLASAARRHPGNAVRITVAVVGTDAVALAATARALAAQWLAPARTIVVASATEIAMAARTADADWWLVLGAGEVLSVHALACFAHEVRRTPDAAGFVADVDCIDHGVRRNPLFKPGADRWLLRSGLPTRGACLFRHDVLAAWSDDTPPDTASWRCALASTLPAGSLRTIPLVLTHVPDAPIGKPKPASPRSTAAPFVSIVIPTAATSRHMLGCLRRVITTTSYPGKIEILLAVSHRQAGDRRQAARLARAGALPGVRVIHLGLSGFNYAQVNNLAVRQAQGELVLLLNDDVAPIGPAWLHRMVAYHDDEAAIIGARLLYGNASVQHGGVIMGLANLCEHAFRLRSRSDVGPHGLAVLDRQVSAVTAACMLLSRSLYETSGGMDPSFAIALNDVDFCLRVGQAGGRVVFAAGVELHHYESLSLGRHYGGDRSALECQEVGRLRDRWSAVIASDPFYSPAASLEPGREFQPGFPPRVTPTGWISGETPAPT